MNTKFTLKEVREMLRCVDQAFVNGYATLKIKGKVIKIAIEL